MPSLDIDNARESEIADFVIHMAIPRLGPQYLPQVKDAAEERQREIQEDARAKLLESFRQQAAELGIPLESLFPGMGGRRRATGTVPIKYRHPDNPNLVWTGRGQMVAWLRELQEQGEDISKYLVRQPESAEA